jgi:hypothetical protein
MKCNKNCSKVQLEEFHINNPQIPVTCEEVGLRKAAMFSTVYHQAFLQSYVFWTPLPFSMAVKRFWEWF